MNFPKLASGNCLFMICPTDYMESVLNPTCCGKAYFHTALGASFNWDITIQQDISQLIENQNINQIIFVTKYTNLFYKEAIETEDAHVSFGVSQTMIELEKTLPNYFLSQSHPILRVMLLASRHLQKQYQYILKTSVLGKDLKQKGIATKSFVYHPDTEIFYTPRMIEKKILLHGTLFPN